ncbi:MAG: inositol monophosphatase [Anaerolineae bacterium]|nr:inositol monophosphatase [Anaerolineae bacterium]
MSTLEAYCAFATEVARAAGCVIRDSANGPVGVYSKGLRDLVTDVDLAAERTIVDAIRARYPNHDVLSEEMPARARYPNHDVLSEEMPARARSSAYQWVIDPLDGTGNFARGYPCYSVSVALVLDGEPLVGVVHDPMRDQVFSACRGGGAMLDGQPIRVSRVSDVLDTLIGMDWTRDPVSRAKVVQIVGRLAPRCGSIRVCGSAALGMCYVAAGWWDAYWHLSLEPWDAAAGALIVREAGGMATDLAGAPWQLTTRPLLASSGALHEILRELIAP